MQQSQSITPFQSAPAIQASVQAAFKPGEPGADVQPDLSHLTPEERRIIEDVISRQRQEELIDRQVYSFFPSFTFLAFSFILSSPHHLLPLTK